MPPSGEIAPMPFLTYAETRPGPSDPRAGRRAQNAAVVRRPAYGHFANDRSLSQMQIDMLAAWVNRGAPAGDPKDAPPPREWPEGWNIGTPDAIFEMPSAFAIPAKGAVDIST